MRLRFFYRLGLSILALLLAVLAGLYAFQDRLIFQSVPLDRAYSFRFDFPFEEFFLPVKAPPANNQSDTVNVLWFRPDSASRGLILYFHGNRGNLQRWGNFAPDLTRLGFDVVMLDYRGYGKSTGSPTEASLYSDAETVLNWAMGRQPQGKLIIYGRSLGSAAATSLAAKVTPDLLILETPFDQLRGVLTPYGSLVATLTPLRYTMSNANHLRQVRCRTIIFHGTDDRIVPLASAEKLRPLIQSADDFVIIQGGGHRGLRSFPEYQSRLAQVLGSL
jgi:pimeloyl-ACP methyl ester carboxylesterase